MGRWGWARLWLLRGLPLLSLDAVWFSLSFATNEMRLQGPNASQLTSEFGDGSKTDGPVSAASAITATGKTNVVVTRAAKRVSAINRARENLIGPTSNFNLSRHPSDAINPAPAVNQSQVE